MHRLTNNKLQIFFLIISILIPLTISLILILSVNLTFWYDNSRDLLNAWDSLSKFTLIGPPSGIPGIFYGPYWIWLLQFGLLFSKNPLYVTLITATIPYFVIFPFIWFITFGKFFNKTSLLIGWLLFMFSSGMTYAIQLWNLYPAPLITLAIIYLFIISDFTKSTKSQTFISLGIGFLIGLLINFHISFGIAFLTGSVIFLLVDTIITYVKSAKKVKQKIILQKILYSILLGTGIFISFIPTLLFELRHGFHQLQALLHTFSKYGDVVTVTGLNKSQILQTFIVTFGNLLHVPVVIAGFLLLMLLAIYIYLIAKHKLEITSTDRRILLLLSSLFAGVLFIFLSAKNPVWEYHFIGVDILFLVAITFFASKLLLFRKILVVYTIAIVCISVATFIINFHKHNSHFEQQIAVVQTVKNDAKNNEYTVFAYNASIYTYDFSYLFRWMAHKDIPFDPGLIKQSTDTIYLIIPKKIDSSIQNFITFRSQPKKYTLVHTWKTETDFAILKFQKR